MKIGIVTFHSGRNVGAVLQAYALQTCLNKLGHTVEVIDYQENNKYTWRKFVAKDLKRMIRQWIDVYNDVYYRKLKDIGYLLHKSAKKYKTYEDLKKEPPIYDVYIVGSDQVWNFSQLNLYFLLDFVPANGKKIAYAVSMGQCKKYPENHRDELRRYLNQFSAISLREEKAVDEIKTLVIDSQNVIKVLDPTLLINKEYYLNLSSENKEDKKIDNMAVSYILGHVDKSQLICIKKYLKNKNNILVNLRNIDTGVYIDGVYNKVVSAHQWLFYIQHAQFVICGSFHATVFALIFHKTFIVVQSHKVKEEGGNVRINSLLKMVNLEDRIMYDDNIDLMDSILSRKIEWDRVDAIIAKEKASSIAFLQKNIV